ncbi:MAG: hypothetical protein E6Q97_39435 [Desulfurellales bacterium]|nr:MAG: hypothetical protein E6Q97_39435 [Desulfurellales bacterium]
MSTMNDYSEYSVTVTNDPSYYGSSCTQADAERIAASLGDMIRGEFPGIRITDSGRGVCGPDDEVVEQIRQWVEENWTNAL